MPTDETIARNLLIEIQVTQGGYEYYSYHTFLTSGLTNIEAIKQAIENEARGELEWLDADFDYADDCGGELRYAHNATYELTDDEARVISQYIS